MRLNVCDVYYYFSVTPIRWLHTRAQFTSTCSYFGAEVVNVIGWPENGHLKNTDVFHCKPFSAVIFSCHYSASLQNCYWSEMILGKFYFRRETFDENDKYQKIQHCTSN